MLGVAQLGGYRINRLRAADEVKNIAELQAGMAAGDQFNPGAIEPRDHHIIALLKVQIANTFTQYFSLVTTTRSTFRSVPRVESEVETSLPITS